MAHNILEHDWLAAGRGINPWHGIGTVVEDTMTADEALRLARLDWPVHLSPVYSGGDFDKPLTSWVGTVRGDTGEVLGIVSPRYRVIQNKDAFAFMDALLDYVIQETGEALYDTAGSLGNGRQVFLSVKLPESVILGDHYKPYLVVTNSHDGTSALKAFSTAVRVVCQNTLNMALSGAHRVLSIRHSSLSDVRRAEAIRAYTLSTSYMDRLGRAAESLVGVKVDIEKLLLKLIPVDDAKSVQVNQRLDGVRESIRSIESTTDNLSNFRGTAWGFVQAVSDYVSHEVPVRKTPKLMENRFTGFVEGYDLLSKAYALVA